MVLAHKEPAANIDRFKSSRPGKLWKGIRRRSSRSHAQDFVRPQRRSDVSGHCGPRCMGFTRYDAAAVLDIRHETVRRHPTARRKQNRQSRDEGLEESDKKTFLIPKSSRRKSSKTSKPPSNNSAKSPPT